MGQQTQCCSKDERGFDSQIRMNTSKFHLKYDQPEHFSSQLGIMNQSQYRQSNAQMTRQLGPDISTQPPQLNQAVKNRLATITQKRTIPQTPFSKKQSMSSSNNSEIHQQQNIIPARMYFCFKKTGVVYQGQWKKGKPHGQGRNFYPNGSIYIGTFEQGIPHGRGEFILSKGDYYYGQIKFGRANGIGTYESQEQVYQGMFKDNMKHGKGQQKANTYYFKGMFEYGEKKKGYLKYGISGTSGIKFRSNQSMNHSGVMTQQKTQNVYDGTFEDQKFHGLGLLKTSQGLYNGSFKKGLQHGYGQFQWKDGSTYKGQYRNGVRKGQGQYFNANNNTISRGMWNDGVLEGRGQYVQAKGTTNRCIWNQGKIVQLLP